MLRTELREEQAWLVVWALVILAAIAVAAALKSTAAVMIPFVLAMFLTTMVTWVVDVLVVHLRVSRVVASLVALFLAVALLVAAGAFLVGTVQTLLADYKEYTTQIGDFTQELVAKLQTWGVDVEQVDLSTRLLRSAPYVTLQVGGVLLNLLNNGFLILIFTAFLLSGRNPHAVRTGIFAEIETTTRLYLTAKFGVSAVTGILVWLILQVLGLPMAPLFGVLAFLLNFIPSIGSIIATFLPLPVAVATWPGQWGWILLVVSLPGAVQIVVGNVVEPRVMGRGLELHPVSILLALAFWGYLWGVVGMVLAAPITAVMRIALVRFETTRAVGNLLAGELPGTSSGEGGGAKS